MPPHGMRLTARYVLKQVLQDLVVPKPRHHKGASVASLIRDAHSFAFAKECEEDLAFWCDLAGMSVGKFRKRAQHVVEHKIDVSQLEQEMITQLTTMKPSDVEVEEVVH